MDCFLSGTDTIYDIASHKYINLYLNSTDIDDFYIGDLVKIDKNDKAVRVESMDDKPVYSFVSYVVQRLKKRPEEVNMTNDDVASKMKESLIFRGCTDCRHRGDCDNCGVQFLKCYSEILHGFHMEFMARYEQSKYDKT